MLKLFLVFIFLQFVAVKTASSNTKEWSKQKLTYSVLKFPTKISRKDTLAAFKNAFDQWSKVVPKTFKKLPKNHTEADFRITFKFIDGPSGRIHRASETGNIEIDDDENWKYYKVGEKVDSQKKDLTYAAMDLIKFILEKNNVIRTNSFSVSYLNTDSDGNYVLPTLEANTLKNVN